MSLFDDRDMAGITSPEFPGERLIVCRNRALAGERARKREDLLAATERDLARIAAAVARKRQPLRSILGCRIAGPPTFFCPSPPTPGKGKCASAGPRCSTTTAKGIGARRNAPALSPNPCPPPPPSPSKPPAEPRTACRSTASE